MAGKSWVFASSTGTADS
ncbi:KxYKxGKxW signal peptide domain-containing protein [Klebsiella sp. I138]